MKLMTYNILNGGEGRLDLILRVIKTENPDFLVINEANRFDKEDKLNKFSKEIGLPYFKLSLSGEFDYHTAVFSKSPFKEIKEIKPLRNAGIITVVETEFGEIAIAGVHLTPQTEDQRLLEVDLILEQQKQYQNKILIGDMNSLSAADNYNEEIIKRFNETQLDKFTTNGKFRFDVINKIISTGYSDTAIIFEKQQIPTVPTEIKADEAHLTNIRVDYIFISESLKNKLKNYSVIKNDITKKTSDHYPVIAEFKFF